VTRDGRRFEHRSTGVPGDPKNPVGWERLEEKFRDCASFSAKPLDAKALDRAVARIRDLDQLSDATEIVRLLS
jgi:2-methylcitrate dehydratase PrpD